MTGDVDIKLRSRNWAAILTILLWGLLTLGLLEVLMLLSIFVLPSLFGPMLLVPTLRNLLDIVLFLVAALVFLIWMYQAHSDLGLIYRSYPISPGGALGRLAIPLYNLWGFWSVFTTLADQFEGDPELKSVGRPIRKMTVWLYLATIFFVLLSFINIRFGFLAVAAIGVLLRIIYLRMVRPISSALTLKAQRKTIGLSATSTKVEANGEKDQAHD